MFECVQRVVKLPKFETVIVKISDFTTIARRFRNCVQSYVQRMYRKSKKVKVLIFEYLNILSIMMVGWVFTKTKTKMEFVLFSAK